MHALAVLAGALLVFVVLWDAFETMVLPRRVARRVRITGFFYRATWRPWATAARAMPEGGRRETFLSFYGPLSLLLLLGVWAASMIAGFALIQWGIGADLSAPEGTPGFGGILYMSGITFLTIGFGDIAPRDAPGRLVAVLEGGTGLGFLALVIGYIPVLYQAFSRREVNVSLLDARAGSPPSAAELLRRQGDPVALAALLQDWERWAAELMESHLSYPVLAYYRSQHEHQSWVAALTLILDVSALVTAGMEDAPVRSARLSFAMARHAAVDLSQVFSSGPDAPDADRLPPADLLRLRALLRDAGIPLREGPEVDAMLREIRHSYEPFVSALAGYTLMPLPPWMPAPGAHDDWQVTAWERPGAAAQH